MLFESGIDNCQFFVYSFMTSITSNESVGSGRHVMSPSTQPTILAMILTLYIGALAQSFEHRADSEAIAALLLVWRDNEVD